ncbi:hypothetical protein SAMN05421823_103525 [Catalinimonas alkaloidigena]|uniref:Uncharacterized protein n=1 Tax=Catalinimonas alkaloidigena TaxID=1075417 RepID=A0A1G9EMM1_9BACT|nr:hypothetical protein [Catalinimonas alkaloidigena]SDK77338.1 hypothetical protein SAMN05421823_103525 [Catalinimonas alkaloidigena]
MRSKNPYIQESVKFSLTVLSCGKYELECYVFEQKLNAPTLFVKDLETGYYNYVGDFFRFNWHEKDITEDLIPTIDEVVERNWGDEVLVSVLLTAIIDPHKTYFTSEKNLTEGIKMAVKDDRMNLDTLVFRQIATKWLNFLNSLAAST